MSADQLKRWRHWGVAPRSPERVRGFRPSLDESIPDAELEQVAEVARLVSEGNSRVEVVIRMAADGWPVHVEVVKTATQSVAKRLIGRLGHAGSFHGSLRRKKGVQGEIRARLEAFGEDADMMSMDSATGRRRRSSRGFIDTFADGVKGSGKAAHLGGALPALNALSADTVVRQLCVARQLAQTYVNVPPLTAEELVAGHPPTAEEIVAGLLDGLNDVSRPQIAALLRR